MIVKTFSGPNLRDALKSVRDAFGEDAVILDTKFEANALARAGNRMQQVHVTAAFEPDVATASVPEGPRTLRLKGGLGDAPAVEDEPSATTTAGGPEVNTPEIEDSMPSPDIAGTLAQLVATLRRDESGSAGPRPQDLLTWLTTRPKLAGEMIDAFATDTAEALAPYGPFLEREKAPLRVLFIGHRGSGKSNALFKTYATRWRQTQNAPGLILVSEAAAHNHERLAATCQSCGVSLTTHALSDGRLSVDRQMRRRDLFVEYTPAQGDYDLAHSAKKILKATNPDVVVLTVSATETDGHWARAAEKFAAFKPTHLAVTHWDDEQPWWRLAGFARTFGLSLSYRTCGTDLFDEIDPFTEADVRTGLVEQSTASLISGQTSIVTQGRDK